MRKLASLVAREEPDVLAVCEIDPGDALSLATRFALQWAYRGRQALFWRDAFRAGEIDDLYLPARPERPFDRRGFVRVDAIYERRECVLIATQFARERSSRILELRFARTQLRNGPHDALLFAHLAEPSIGFEDLGFRDAIEDAGKTERVYVRGFENVTITPVAATV